MFTTSQFFKLVQQAGQPGTSAPEALASLYATVGVDEGVHHPFGDPDGGFLVPSAVWQTPLRAVRPDPLGTRTLEIPMGTPKLSVPARIDTDHQTSASGGLVLYRLNEPGAIPATRTQYGAVRLNAENPLVGLTFASRLLIGDSADGWMSIVGLTFQDQLAAQLADERINGDGIGGRFVGVLNSPCTITVPKAVGQAATTIVKANVDAMAARCWDYGSAIWLANPDTQEQLRSLVQVVGTAGAPASYFTTVGDQEYFAGRPIFWMEHCQTLGTRGDLILGNWSQYLDGIYRPITGVSSVWVRWIEHECAFRFTTQRDGAPWWLSPLTPKYSSATLSPFVTLAART